MQALPDTMIETLQTRASLLQRVRQFFIDRDVLEVDVPVLGKAPVTDPYIEALKTENLGQTLYLQTSPEYYMKRLLAADSGSIFYLNKAFRAEESGRLHSPEFTMLEWYRVGFDDQQLMDEIDALLQMVLACEKAERVSYQALFEQHFQINPHAVALSTLQSLVKEHCGDLIGLENPTETDCLQLLFSEVIEPTLGQDRPAFVIDYPQAQAALAKLKTVDGQTVASRFEVFYKGIELANGYHELTDAAEQRKRFEVDLAQRKQLGLPEVPIDEDLLAALAQGLPDCAGVALGFDRLLMLSLKLDTIDSATCF